MTKLTVRVGAAVAASALVLTASMGSALAKPPTVAETTTYAALGDSYSAGVGAGIPTDGCFRSQAGYPVLIADATGWDLNYQACSGARIGEVLTNQVPNIAGDTDVITITVGGNDVGFTPVLLACATQPEAACAGAVAQAETAISTALPGGLTALYTAIRATAPQATVVVVGYPNLFKKGDCFPDGVEFTKTEINLLNKATDLLNDTIRAQVEAAGFLFADPTPAFKGHATCATVTNINAGNTAGAAFHPNEAGQVVYARVIARQLGVNGQVTKATAGR